MEEEHVPIVSFYIFRPFVSVNTKENRRMGRSDDKNH
jgi:hypothetical protein